MRALKDIIVGAIIAFAIFVLLYIFYMPEPKVKVLEKRIIDRDTVLVVDYLQADTVYIEKEVTLYDTIFITRDGDTTATEVAKTDTSFEDGAGLSVLYFLSPRVFEIEYTPAPVEIRTNTVTQTELVYVDSSAWWDKVWIGGVGGAVFTAMIVSLVK